MLNLSLVGKCGSSHLDKPTAAARAVLYTHSYRCARCFRVPRPSGVGASVRHC